MGSTLFWILGILTCWSTVTGRHITTRCIHFYDVYNCLEYSCDKILDLATYEKDFKKDTDEFIENSRICEATTPIQNAPGKSYSEFPPKYLNFGNRSTSFFHHLKDKHTKTNKYCYDKMEPTTGPDTSAEILEPQSRKYKICTPIKPYINKQIRDYQQISTFVSPIFIFLPICVFLLTYEIQNFHGWTHFTNACCVFSLYISWGLRYLYFRESNVGLGSFRCTSFAAVQHYLHISVFSWLVVACHDLQKLAESHSSGKSLDTKKQLVMYTKLSIFGWGIPAAYLAFLKFVAIVFTSLGMDSQSYFASFILPEYGKFRCFLAFNAYWLHLFFPTLTLFVAAIFYNWRTLRIILQNKNDLSMEHAVQKVNVIRNMACLRAITLASVCWGCDVFRSLLTAYDRGGLLWLRVLLDTVILYQTIPICFIYSCRPHILNHMEAKYPVLSCPIEASRRYLHIKRKEVDPDVVTQLRVHRKSEGDILELQQRSLQSS